MSRNEIIQTIYRSLRGAINNIEFKKTTGTIIKELPNYECYEVLLDGVYESRVFHRNELEKQKVSS